ncbi:MAG: NAD(P)-dependent oxidoreductase [Kiritimatiellae bacterium]|nr:NAD(P)-dependent oxidoreductase [Kiritimatiellia bacterium]
MTNWSKIVLLGHTGFIGSRLADRFRRAYPDVPIEGRSFPAFDLAATGAHAELEPLFDERALVVFLSGIKRQFGDDLDTFNKNVQMALAVCRALKARPVARLIFFSSAAVYGEDIHNTAITEDAPICPTSFYGMAKFVSERMLWKTMTDAGRGSLAILRPPTVYGPGDPGKTYGPSGFVQAAIKGESITLWGDGEELRDFLWLDDLVEAVLALAANSFAGVLNLVTGQSVTFRQMLDLISKRLGRPLEIKSRPRSKNKVDNVFVNDRLRTVLPNLRFTPMEEGIARLLANQGM